MAGNLALFEETEISFSVLSRLVAAQIEHLTQDRYQRRNIVETLTAMIPDTGIGLSHPRSIPVLVVHSGFLDIDMAGIKNRIDVGSQPYLAFDIDYASLLRVSAEDAEMMFQGANRYSALFVEGVSLQRQLQALQPTLLPERNPLIEHYLTFPGSQMIGDDHSAPYLDPQGYHDSHGFLARGAAVDGYVPVSVGRRVFPKTQ